MTLPTSTSGEFSQAVLDSEAPHGCETADSCVLDSNCPFVADCQVVETGGADLGQFKRDFAVQFGTAFLLNVDAHFDEPGSPLALTPDRARELAARVVDGGDAE